MCLTQLGELQQNHSKIQSEGAILIAISADNVNRTKTTVDNEGLNYLVLSDNNKETITAYNVVDQSNTKIARPVSYILNSDGVVEWKSIDTAAARVPTTTILTELGKL